MSSISVVGLKAPSDACVDWLQIVYCIPVKRLRSAPWLGRPKYRLNARVQALLVVWRFKWVQLLSIGVEIARSPVY